VTRWSWLTAACLLVGAATAVAADPADPVDPAEQEGPRYAIATTRDRGGRVLAPVYINGRGPFRFILDTGANRSAMSAATAESVGLVLEEGSVASVHGITGSAVLPLVDVQSFRAGDLALEHQRMPVLPAAVFGGADGILGVDSLQHARVEVDFERDEVTIRRSTGRRAGPDYFILPARVHHGGLLLMNGRIGGVKVKAILDTGAERSLGNEVLRARLIPAERRRDDGTTTTVIGATPQLVEGTSYEAPMITIGGARLSKLTVTFGDLHVFKVWDLLDEPALLLGMDLLGTLPHFAVDYPRHEFQFKTRVSTRPSSRR
jgi:predicted aspartyl protease